MTQIFQPIETCLGVISGRDAIYLDNIHFDYSKHFVQFVGEINGHLCSINSENAEFIKYTLSFSGLLSFKMIELDFEDYKGNSSFDEVINSEWISQMRKYDSASKVKPEHKHYFLRTYDDIFEIVCKNYELKIT